jgi:alkylation response protein AidB-like acyl-CoA dehydrogenase
MPAEAAIPTATDLRTPVTPQGRALLDLLDGHLEEIRAGAEENDRAAAFPFDTFESFRKDGVLAATVPAELGGLGVSRLYDVAVALRAVAAADASTALALHVQFSRGLTLAYEWRHGTDRAGVLAERLLRLMAAGEAAVCGGVKDHFSTATTLTPDGSGGWRLSGRKMLVSMAPIATHFVVHAQLRDGEPEQDGRQPLVSVPVLSRDTPGLSVLDSWDGLGMRASGTFDVAFDDCPVATEDLLLAGAEDTRDDAVLAGQTVSSIGMLGIYAGVAQAARDIAVGRIARRSADPSGATSTLVAETEARLYALQATAGAALANADLVSADLDVDPGARGRRMMVPFQCAKMTVNQLALDIVNDCLTLVGGAAYSAADPLSRLYRDVRAGWFMQPYTYPDGVDFLSGQALGLDRNNDYVSGRIGRPSDGG